MFIVRDMLAKDILPVALLLKQLSSADTDLGEFSSRFQELSGPNNGFFVAEDNKKIVGWVQVECRNFFLFGLRSEIMGLVVDVTHRRRGVGKALIEEAEKWAFDRSSLVRLSSNVLREESHPFYLSQGYELRKKSVIYEKQR